MTCKHCGTEIAANALICFRCGRATAEPTAAAGPAGKAGNGGGWISIVAAVLLAAVALFMGRSTYAEVPRELSWVVGGLAAVVLIWRLVMRRR